MASTSPIIGDDPYGQVPDVAAPEQSDRVRRLEGELAELRDTVARFAEMMIGEVKELRSSQVEQAAIPPMPGELPIDVAQAALPAPDPARRPWLLMELARDFGATVRMYLDPRYRLRRSTQMLVPLILALFVLNYVFFQHVFTVLFLSNVTEKFVDVVLAILLYKVISRELVRYRQVLIQLQSWQGYRRRHNTVILGGEPPTTRLETE